MKVVVNRRYGGFGLSHEAELMLVGKCRHGRLIPQERYFGGTKNRPLPWEKEMARSQESALFAVTVVDGMVCLDDHRSTLEGPQSRSCPQLVAVVESLGNKANGKFAALVVVEIPDGIDYEIEEYDGHESIHEQHRSW